MTLPLISEEAKKNHWTEANNSPDGRGNYHGSTNELLFLFFVIQYLHASLIATTAGCRKDF